eukprot:869646-Karenia_brevis.AAC.1
MGSGDSKLKYEKVKHYVLNLAQQRASSMQPRPSEVLGVDGQEEEAPVEEKYRMEEWMSWMWDVQ